MPQDDSKSSAFNDPDKRYFPRWEVDEEVSFHLPGNFGAHEGKTRDISCAGACVVGDVPLEPHQKVRMTIQLSKGTTIKVNAHILWIKEKNGERQMGVSFFDTTDEVKDAILQHAFEVDRDKVVQQWFRGWK